MARVFITRTIPDSGPRVLKAAGHSVTAYAGKRVIPRAQLLRAIVGKDAVLTLLTDKVDSAFLKAAGKQLKIVANYAVGYDNIDVAACAKAGVVVTNTQGVLSQAVAEHAIALMMATARRIVESDGYMRKGKYHGWEPELLLGMEMKGKTLGVVGLGRIGSTVASIAAKGFGMKVAYTDVKPNADFEKELGARFMPLDALLREADVVSIHVPLLPATRHLIDAKKLKLMKKTAYLINTSRGPIVDEKALVSALKNKQIAGAGLDVFEFEPKLAPGLAKLPNVVMTPHTASATIEARQAMSKLAAENILAVLSGKPAVTPVKLA